MTIKLRASPGFRSTGSGPSIPSLQQMIQRLVTDSISTAFPVWAAANTHPAGYAPGSDEWWVQGPDTTAPTVTAFACDATSFSLVVPISRFTATDDVAVTGYVVTESATPPAADAAGWSATAPTSVTASAPGTITFYAWAKDAAGNVSASLSDSCEITVTDTTAPTVTAFVIPATSDSRTIAISSFTASDDIGVTGYKITETGTPPLASDPGWTGSAPTTYTVSADGAYTLRGWAKDAAGNVSNAATDSCTVTLVQVATPTFSPVAGTYNADQSVAVSCATVGASLYWTDDGTAPTTASTPYTAPIPVTATKTLRVLAVKAGQADSSIGVAAYTLTCATPTFSPAAGDYTGTQTVTISSATSGAAIRYALDGSTPDGSSTLYSAPISVTMGTTVKAIAIKTGYSNSAVGSAAYALNYVLNGGFETQGAGDATTAASWVLEHSNATYGTTQRVATNTDSIASHSGSWMARAKILAAPGAIVAAVKSDKLITGDQYRASSGTARFWVYLAGASALPSSDVNRGIALYVTAYDTGDVMLASQKFRVAGGLSWVSDDTGQVLANLPAAAWTECSISVRPLLDALLGANLANVAKVTYWVRVGATTVAMQVNVDDARFY